MLALQKQRLDAGESILRYSKSTLRLPEWKRELPWLKTDTHSQALQQTLKSLDRALMDAFDKKNPKKFPRFKKKGQRDSFCYPQGCKLEQQNSRIYLPKIGWVRYRNSREVLGTVKNVTVSRSGDKWYVSIQTERDVEAQKHPGTSTVGIDMGIARFATLSDGSIVALEDLRIRNMSASASGTREQPGTNVNQKRGLNRSILDQGWYEFRRQLEYKQVWRGGLVLAVPPQNTSRSCPNCGHVSADNRKTQAKFECVACGHSENADLVAAINILAAGHAVSVCEEMVQSDLSVKQEPTERPRHAA